MEERSQVGQKRESTRGTLTISTNQSSGHEYTPALPARSWEMVACQSTSVFPYRETEASLHQSCPVLRGGRLRSQLWRDYYWHETCIRVSVPLVRLTGLDALGTQLTRLFPSNHRSHRPLRHRT